MSWTDATHRLDLPVLRAATGQPLRVALVGRSRLSRPVWATKFWGQRALRPLCGTSPPKRTLKRLGLHFCTDSFHFDVQSLPQCCGELLLRLGMEGKHIYYIQMSVFLCVSVSAYLCVCVVVSVW